MRPLKQRTILDFKGEKTMTEQSHKEDVDINQIMARAMRGEQSEYMQQNQGRYGDVSPIQYHQAQIIMADARSLFEGMPAKIRNKFDNNPEKFLKYVQDDKNKSEMIELGMITNPEETKDQITEQTIIPKKEESKETDKTENVDQKTDEKSVS